MRYAFLAFILVVISGLGVLGFRGQKFSHTPVEVFSDMDHQAKLKAQKPSDFFADGDGSRRPIEGTVPLGYEIGGSAADGTVTKDGFGTGDHSYYNTGMIGDAFGTGMPAELGLTADNVDAFLRRGHERYDIYCAPCHSESGNGQGVVAKRGFLITANLHGEQFNADNYADGQIFSAITNGKNLMKHYSDKLNVHDRWAVVAYVRALQELTAGVALDTPGLKDSFGDKLPAKSTEEETTTGEETTIGEETTEDKDSSTQTDTAPETNLEAVPPAAPNADEREEAADATDKDTAQ